MNHLERALDHQNEWWKYLIVFVIGFLAANVIGAIPLIIVIVAKTVESGGDIQPNPGNMADLSVYGISGNLGLFLLILPFLFGLLAMIPMFKILHKRHLKEIINGTMSVRWGRFFFSAAIWGIIMLASLLLGLALDPENFKLQFDPNSFFILILISLVFIPFQTTYEEVVFRGYFAQAVGAWTKNRWLVILIPSILFGLMHIMNPEVEEYGILLMLPQYISVGLILGIAATLDDGIETAMGLHAINNIFLSIFLTSKSSVLQTPAMFEQLNIEPVTDLIMLWVFGAIYLLIMGYKYKWKFGMLNQKVEKEEGVLGLAD
ncbi:CPBP family intramembrane glutamic endopeptidase [Flammeovirgaceae bacterium SG7u.111]|nr:CPBP family intramembrane glutamic endopeptidase [Flammeovirgaceae bacterium SG7u.132]WPO36097.1 CPBP family intramembrane glutamic endopeptidase [Flammeovirgaceae bacterium SG7u.111]